MISLILLTAPGENTTQSTSTSLPRRRHCGGYKKIKKYTHGLPAPGSGLGHAGKVVALCSEEKTNVTVAVSYHKSTISGEEALVSYEKRRWRREPLVGVMETGLTQTVPCPSRPRPCSAL